MSQKIADLAKQLDITSKKLKEEINKLGFEVKPKARTIDDEVAELVLEELRGLHTKNNNKDTVQIYEELYDKELDKEIIKKQRKRTAGKNSSKDKNTTEEEEKPSTKKPGSKKTILIPTVISVKEFAEKTGSNPAKVIGELMKNGILANINQQIDYDTAAIIAEDLGIKIKRKRDEAALEDLFEGDLEALLKEDDKDDLSPRPPIISVMGHVDHGKTKILDYIRSANVIDTEAGGITQHIGAYQVEKNGKKITFLDTPGHAAFTAMRARGAKATDIAILVVAADEGVKPQTIEAINHAQDAGIPIIVAINKIDKPNAAPDKVKGELAEHGLQAEDWGGKTIMTPVSAITGEGMDTLLDMILLTAEMEDLKANPNRDAVATVIESHLDKNLGPIATVLINTGTLEIMDNVVVGTSYGRIKVMKDHTGKNMKKARPATPVLIAGLSKTPQSGDILQVVKDEKTARTRATQLEALHNKAKKQGIAPGKDIIARIASGKLKTLKIVLKADTKGSLEAINQSLNKIKDKEVAIKIIHSGVGNVNESDVMMASASGGLVVGFHVNVPSQVDSTAEREQVEILQYKIIYKLTDDIKKLLSGLLEPEIIDVDLGKVSVKKIFYSGKKQMIIGCKVTNGRVENKAQARIVRDDEVVGEFEIESLRKVDEKVKEIKEGNECGIKISRKIDVQEGDILDIYKQEKKIRTL
ncbi:translation initiation factor IF-2 [Candidatus Peregrinibacteria bacterium]|nr:translation initiation factor IF-2 [Candidatus Peregrinibacteria bacterium]